MRVRGKRKLSCIEYNAKVSAEVIDYVRIISSTVDLTTSELIAHVVTNWEINRSQEFIAEVQDKSIRRKQFSTTYDPRIMSGIENLSEVLGLPKSRTLEYILASIVRNEERVLDEWTS